MQIAIVDKSTVLASHHAELSAIAAALNYQMHHDASPIWGPGASVAFYADAAKVPVSACVLYAFDDADQAGALGYHDEDPMGRYFGKIFAKTILDNGGTLMSGGLSVAATFSHEALEMWMDAPCNRWCQRADGTLVALELGDPVENDYYLTTVGSSSVALSNFVTPQWFDSYAHGSRYDFLRKCSTPFQMTPYGYMITMTAGKVSDVFGEHYPEWKKAMKRANKSSRLSRRHKHG